MSTPPVVPPILTGDPPTPTPPPHYTRCDFCECVLTPQGQVYKVSDKARELRDQKEKYDKQIEGLNETITTLRAENDAQRRKIEALETPTPTGSGSRRSFL